MALHALHCTDFYILFILSLSVSAFLIAEIMCIYLDRNICKHFRVSQCQCWPPALSLSGIGYLGKKMRVDQTIGLIYARIWHPSMTGSQPRHSPPHLAILKHLSGNDRTRNSRISKSHNLREVVYH